MGSYSSKLFSNLLFSLYDVKIIVYTHTLTLAHKISGRTCKEILIWLLLERETADLERENE